MREPAGGQPRPYFQRHRRPAPPRTALPSRQRKRDRRVLRSALKYRTPPASLSFAFFSFFICFVLLWADDRDCAPVDRTQRRRFGAALRRQRRHTQRHRRAQRHAVRHPRNRRLHGNADLRYCRWLGAWAGPLLVRGRCRVHGALGAPGCGIESPGLCAGVAARPGLPGQPEPVVGG